MDRQEKEPAGSLQIAELLAGSTGLTPRVLTITQRERGFNLEVDGDHGYWVGEQGVLVQNASAGRVTESNRVAAYAAAPVNSIVPDPALIAQVIGSGGLNATGRHTSILGGILQFILRGRSAGFLGLTRDAGSRTNLVFMRIQMARTSDVIIVAVDLNVIPANTVYTPDTPVGTPPQPLFDALLAQYPNSPRLAPTLPVLRNEGWTAIDGNVPTAAIVKLLRTTNNVAAATIAPLLIQLFS